ncbi:MAG: asparagine synthase (glutamine-hydrolyzing) [Actinobacteria bacterium]|nr:asparagine synthase (glutamine-hydrolyzing) [Actinomycetota bacterium]
MCGIAGILDLRERTVDPHELHRMARAIRHRGPDDVGVHVSANVGLLNVRLAVIDPTEAGHQPMASDDGRLVLVYNGELYNFRELAAELRDLGHGFRSRTDTEVVLRAFEQWGPACVERFNGMFALAVWDARAGEIFLARDRFGVKPLYTVVDAGRLLFGSEVKALIEAGYRPSVSPGGLAEYFTFQNTVSDLTLFEGVSILPAGSTMVAGRTVGHPRRYWDVRFEPERDVPADEWIGLVASTFEDAVRRQLVSDVPVGSYLSGGMDSASIAAVASRSIPRLMTFTGGFDMSVATGMEMVFDERADAERVASTFRTEHYEMVMHAGDMAWVLPELIWHLEDLRAGMCYQNHYIARLASKFVTVALAGTGGDELFAGYPWRYDLVRHLDDPATFEQAHYAYWTRLVPDAEKPSFFSASAWERVGEHAPLDAYRRAIEPAAGFDPLSRAIYFEAKTFLHGLLVIEDRVSMAHSLESRVPFLDNELVDLALRIPLGLQVTEGSGKQILRAAMREVLPAEIIDKPKQGFSPPDESWYKGPTMQYIREVLLDPRTLARDWFREHAIRRVLDQHASGRRNHRLLIWSLLSFEWWNRLFVDGESPSRHAQWHVDDDHAPRSLGAAPTTAGWSALGT